MNVEECKRRAAEAALDYIGESRIIGIGTGTTVGHFLDVLTPLKSRFDGAVSSSEETSRLLREIGIPVLDLNSTGELDVYIDGADEADKHLRLIKGGGGALTREKIVAAASRKFVCIVDKRKRSERLAGNSLPVEVIPMARSFVARQLVKMHGRPTLRESYVTDNGNVILEVSGLKLADPVKVEEQINNVPGVVGVGLFARRPADVVLVGGENAVETLTR